MAFHVDYGNLLIIVVVSVVLGYYIYLFHRDSRVIPKESFDLIKKNIDNKMMMRNDDSEQYYADYHQDQNKLQNNNSANNDVSDSANNNTNNDTNDNTNNNTNGNTNSNANGNANNIASNTVDKIKVLDDRLTKIESRLNTTEMIVNDINTKINSATTNNSKPIDNKTNATSLTQNLVNTSGVYGLLDDPISAIANYELTNCIKDTAGKCVVMSPYLM
jgi:hypothetical protein